MPTFQVKFCQPLKRATRSCWSTRSSWSTHSYRLKLLRVRVFSASETVYTYSTSLTFATFEISQSCQHNLKASKITISSCSFFVKLPKSTPSRGINWFVVFTLYTSLSLNIFCPFHLDAGRLANFSFPTG